MKVDFPSESQEKDPYDVPPDDKEKHLKSAWSAITTC